MRASGSRGNDAELGQSGVDFVLLSLLAYELFAFTLEEPTRSEGLIVIAEELVLIQKREAIGDPSCSSQRGSPSTLP